MRRVRRPILTAAALCLVVASGIACGQEAARAVPDGGVHAPGWRGSVDATDAAAGRSVANARFAPEGDGFRVTTGPAATYWNPADTASGDYTVTATFTEPKYMNLNSHPHPYGVMIGGSGLGTPDARYLYCAAHGNGGFIVRGFGPSSFQLNGPRATPSPAVHKAAAPGAPVTQEIALSVKGDQVQCAINGTVVASYPKSDLVGAGRLASTDGVYGLRFAHNTEVTVSGLGVTRP